MKKDYSKEIYENYFSQKNKIPEITLNDDRVLEGIFVSYVHGDRDFDESYIIKWHFVAETEIEKHARLPHIDFGEEVGAVINQSEIKTVTFRLNQ